MTKLKSNFILPVLLTLLSSCSSTQSQPPQSISTSYTEYNRIPENINDFPPEVRALLLGSKRAFNNKPSYPQLLAAISKIDLTAVEKIIDSGIPVNPDKNSKHESALRFAARTAGTSEIIKFLIAEGAEPDNPGYSALDNTPLQAALVMEHLDNAKILVDAGADLTLKDNNQLTPFMQLYRSLDWASNDNKKNEIQSFINYLIEHKGIDPEERYKAPFYLADNTLGISVNRIENISDQDCLSLLDQHDVKYNKLGKTGAVKTPILVTSPIGGVWYKHTGKSKKHSVMDCRLTLSLIGISSVLKEFDVKEIHHMRAHSSGARIGGGGNTSGHHYGLALDISKIITSDGEQLEIVKDWQDRRHRAEVCKSNDDDSEKQLRLRNFICQIDQQEVFSWILTPHYNKAHYDHFHVEVRPGEGRILR